MDRNKGEKKERRGAHIVFRTIYKPADIRPASWYHALMLQLPISELYTEIDLHADFLIISCYPCKSHILMIQSYALINYTLNKSYLF